MDEVGKALVIVQLLPGGRASGAACQDFTTQMSDSGQVKLGSTTFIAWPDPFPQHHPEPPIPTPLSYYQLHYLLMSSSLTCAKLWRSSTCGGFVFLVFFSSVSELLTWRSFNYFPLSPPKPFKRFYPQEYLVDVTPSWRVCFKCKILSCLSLFCLFF